MSPWKNLHHDVIIEIAKEGNRNQEQWETGAHNNEDT